ncbi:hypothetical protein L873DRAFT_1797887 [Choiromyces venosus 120613-1]|uniref:Ubiquitin 3 binding protein But2 C-terminal domain-containing protein n=1 Tax=Choiromyces venosus 120613-1 TaxID=1336337 RepID=A0A3N4K560_9PEZI|nr:hypothetical protein L873DRAFT_1797887 [Choiromyces venosus 120613-1]
MKTFATLSALMALTSTASASAPGVSFSTLFARAPPALDFTPGIKVPTDCFDAPGGPECPAQLPSGNLLVTAKHLLLDEAKPNEESSLGSNTLQVNIVNQGDKWLEQTTLSLFDFPTGYEDKRCIFHFIHQGGNTTVSDLYSVWELEGNGTTVTEKTTWASRPKRVKVLGLFDTKESEQVPYPTKKFGAPFLSGIGFRVPGTLFLGSAVSFNCPKGGRITFEIANAVPKRGAQALKVTGNLGLGIEVLDAPTPWFGFKAAVRGNRG